MPIVDTQIISYCYSGHWAAHEAHNAEISSITASEFLLFHTRENSKVDYYVINPNKYGKRHSHMLNPIFIENAKNSKWAMMGAKRTDSLIIDFSTDYQPYRVFGNDAITSIINEKDIETFKLSILHLDKQKQKNLKKKIEFIFDNNMFCHRINENTYDISMKLLEKFKDNITPKENIKNTINDLLILSTAIDNKKSLRTHDKVLGRFAAEEYSGQVTDETNTLLIDFSSQTDSLKIKTQESKGYVNRGWSYSFLKGNF